ncbi:hypothetical protein PoB_003700900 [Plakobranchus ocellatus]|uniref:Uncharacterized protein n=1 Tax=Plakobranchus ocellatus TaxID=259542 RepID=A0AAV4ARS3_9GAST|nr:hypothetical protein PoB_003700900 [Plakobranchus ocellatus]
MTNTAADGVKPDLGSVSAGGGHSSVGLSGAELDAAVASITEQAMNAMKQAYSGMGIGAIGAQNAQVADATSALVAKAVAAANQAQARVLTAEAGPNTGQSLTVQATGQGLKILPTGETAVALSSKGAEAAVS